MANTSDVPSHATTYNHIRTLLLPPNNPSPILQPNSNPRTQATIPRNASLTPQIASLLLHPTLEVLFHILNTDLTSAHFLVRHMESPPKYEAMLLHALLHRIEGDTENARAWYGDVSGSGVFEFVWAEEEADVDAVLAEAEEEKKRNSKQSPDSEREPGSDAVRSSSACLSRASNFLDALVPLRSTRNKQHGMPEWQARYAEIESVGEQEVRRILTWCERQFGTARWEDASRVWIEKGKKNKEMASEQVVGGEGWRQF